MNPLLVASLAVLGVALLLVGLALPRTGRDVVAERLAGFTTHPQSLEELELRQPFSERVLRPFIRQLAEGLRKYQEQRATPRRTGEPTAGDGVDPIQLKLTLAGTPYNWTPADYLGTKLFAALVLGGGFFFLMTIGGQAGLAFVFGAVGVGFGWLGPDLILRSRTRARQKAIQRALPDALDLLVISVEAGLGFDAALQRLVDKQDNPLTRELARVLAEMRVGRSRRAALRDLVARTQVQDLSNFVASLLQAESLGVSVTRVLSSQADQMRTARRQRAEEQAAQLQLKMLFPLAFFIFPALCIVILGPIWPTIAAVNAPGV